MDLLGSEAWAQTAGGTSAQSGFASLIPLVLIFVIFYFLLLRPQMKRAKEHKQMVGSLTKGDEVITNGGLVGKVTKVDDSFVSLEIAESVVVRLQKSAIASMLPKGTIKKEKTD